VGKKKLIVIWPYRFRDFDWQRFELEQLSQHFEVHVHELIDALTPEFAAAYANQSDRPEVKRFSSLRDWRREFKKISKHSIIFTHVRPVGPKLFSICLTIRRAQAKTIGFYLGGVAIPEQNKWFFRDQILSSIKAGYHKARRLALGCLSPEIVAVGGSDCERIARRDFGNWSKPLPMSSYDYSTYLGLRELQTQNINSGVFLDTGIPAFLGDFLLLGQAESLKIDEWYPSLSRFFDFTERALGLNIVISVHPKHLGRDHAGLFGGRAIYGGDTALAVKQCKLAISTLSTSVSFAVCFQKPLILVWSNVIESGIDLYKRIHIEKIAKETGAKIFNIDRDYTEKELRDALVIDHAKRESYKRKYLTSRTDDKPNYQVLLDEVINAVD
jgi:hypothetical protein